jgi:hypothetical protein
LDRADRNEVHLAFLRALPTTGPGTEGGALLRQYWNQVFD